MKIIGNNGVSPCKPQTWTYEGEAGKWDELAPIYPSSVTPAKADCLLWWNAWPGGWEDSSCHFPWLSQGFQHCPAPPLVSTSGWHGQNAKREQTEHLLEWWGSDPVGRETTSIQLREGSSEGRQGMPPAHEDSELVQPLSSHQPRAACSEWEDRPNSPWGPSQCKKSCHLWYYLQITHSHKQAVISFITEELRNMTGRQQLLLRKERIVTSSPQVTNIGISS